MSYFMPFPITIYVFLELIKGQSGTESKDGGKQREKRAFSVLIQARFLVDFPH